MKKIHLTTGRLQPHELAFYDEIVDEKDWRDKAEKLQERRWRKIAAKEGRL